MPKSFKWKSFSRWNLRVGIAANFLLTLGTVCLIAWMWFRANRLEPVEGQTETDARAAAILRNLKSELATGAAEKMQVYFPEGACFIHTLYGLAWSNLAESPVYREEGSKCIRAALAGQISAAALEPFRWDTTVRRGAFWLGQRSLLLGKYLRLNPEGDDTITSLTKEFHENAAEFHRGIMEAPVHQVESYHGMCWPADAPAGLAALVIHDEIYGTTFSEALSKWKEYHNANGWKRTALPVGRLDFNTGYAIEPARGCATSLMIPILAEVDRPYARRLYDDYRKHFLINRAGFAMYREYPRDYEGVADVDSGPIVMGAGVTATGVGLAAARAMGDTGVERDIRDLSEMFGFPIESGDKPQARIRYLGGLLPMGDAFLAWGYSTPRADSAVGEFAGMSHRWKFHLIAAGSLIFIIGQLVWNWKSYHKRMANLSASVPAQTAADG